MTVHGCKVEPWHDKLFGGGRPVASLAQRSQAMNRVILIAGTALMLMSVRDEAHARAIKVPPEPRESCTKANAVSAPPQEANRCIEDDTKKRDPAQRLLAPWVSGGPLVVGPNPGDPRMIDANVEATITPAVAVDAGTISFWGFATVSGITWPGDELRLGCSYKEPFLSDAGATLRFVAHSINPNTFAVVSLLDSTGNPLATKWLDLSVAGGEALFSMASPGVYGIGAELWWTSGPLPLGGSGWVSPTVAVDVSFLYLATCPADLNADQLVEDLDFVLFASAYDVLDCADPAMPASCPADLSHDGIVEDGDFVMFAAAYDALLCD